MTNRTWKAVLGLVAIGWLSRCGGGGCGGTGVQSPECVAYLDCYARAGGTGDAGDYEARGICWTTNASRAASCTQACKSTTLTLKVMYPDAGC